MFCLFKQSEHRALKMHLNKHLNGKTTLSLTSIVSECHSLKNMIACISSTRLERVLARGKLRA